MPNSPASAILVNSLHIKLSLTFDCKRVTRGNPFQTESNIQVQTVRVPPHFHHFYIGGFGAGIRQEIITMLKTNVPREFVATLISN